LEYDTYVSEFLAENEVPGTAIAVVEDGEIVFLKAYGIQKVGENHPVDANTVFRIASVSKGFASVLTGLLVRDGILGWDDKVIDYLPDFSLVDTSYTNNLTIRHLLSHTSGVVPHAYDNLVEAYVPIDTVVKRLEKAPVICPVGDCYSYQNVLYSMIGDVVESVTGKSYQELLRERILQPLGMQNTSLSMDGLTASKNYGHPHVRANGQWYPIKLKATYYDVQPAAGINSSIYDMALWLKALLNGISFDIMDEICRPVVRTPHEKHRFNWQNRIKRGPTMVSVGESLTIPVFA
jgi:beta-lactamase class C